MFVLNQENGKIEEKSFMYNPALFKLFDEGIVNCRDHVIRMSQLTQTDNDGVVNHKVTQVNVSIDEESHKITLYNNGNGIDIVKHPEYDIWIPEMIFGHLRTSTNYNKNEKKITGGKNGFGFKLVLIWSKYGRIETVDHKRGLKYEQVFHDNLNVIEPPKITKCKSKPYTKVEFIPDYQRLQMNGLSREMISLFQRRVYDIAGITSKEVKVKYNDGAIKVNDFQQYVNMYLNEDQLKHKIFEFVNERWSFCITLNHEFRHISFVNGIYTSKRGKTCRLYCESNYQENDCIYREKEKIVVKPAVIKEQLFVFINCSIENPSFDSQTKDYLNTPLSKFGSTCDVSDKVIDKLAKMGVMNTSCELSEIKERKKC